MADALLSPLVSTILGNLSSSLLEEFGIFWGLKSELEKLESTLSTIQAVLKDAEEKQWRSEAVKNWLRKLKDAAYDAENVIDDFSIEAQRRRGERGTKTQLSTFVSHRNPLLFRFKMAHQLRNARERLDVIAEEKDKFHLREGMVETEVNQREGRQTCSLVDESEIYGRHGEEENIINLLLTDLRDRCDVSVYAICGMGGLGKTTLAQLVYNDERTKSGFELRIWVCVSDDFEMRRLIRAIIESIEGSPCQIQELDPLQRHLQERLQGRRFLLVLDDVWNEYHGKWDRLRDALRCGAKGSTVIVTTRLEKVALTMATLPVFRLQRLSDDDSWCLFKQRAFGMKRREEFIHLETIGKEIVKKCGGVPLAIKALGSLLRFKNRESQWLSVKESEIWDLPDDGGSILPALKLSYDHLPSYMRQCFAYCSIFPKDYVMEKDMLIELWMANDFIPSRGPMDVYDMGHEIFNELAWRSFFQDIREDISEDIEGVTTCKMHDLMHDLAQSIMKSECLSIENDKPLEVPKKVRHLSFHNNSSNHVLMGDVKIEAGSLRSLMLPSYCKETLISYFSEQNYLRVLRLPSRYKSQKFSKSIDNLKHLRYLDFSYSSIKTLPESTTSLQNLRTLKLFQCIMLVKLPKHLNHLRDLRCLNIKRCYSLTCVPAGLGQLSYLRKLTTFIVGKDHGQSISELKELNLEGELSIEKLDNVMSSREAKSANLVGKPNLRSLSLQWGNEGNQPENAEEVVSGLQPHSNLKKLRIGGYEGVRFPNWIMDSLLPNLVKISLNACNRCEHLPPLGKLPLLNDLFICGMSSVKYIGDEFYGDGVNSFPSLATLSLQLMGSLEKWNAAPRRDSFPLLRRLTISDCPKLAELPVLVSLEELDMENSNLVLVRCFTSLRWLRIASVDLIDLPNAFFQDHMLLEHLEIWSLSNLKSLSNQLNNLHALKSLRLHYCTELETLPDGLQNFNSLETLHIMFCNSLVSLPVSGLRGLSSLRKLSIQNCEKFESLSEGLQYLTVLQNLIILNCPPLNSIPEGIQNLTALKSLTISHCKGLTYLPNQIRHLTSLSSLFITSCHNLMSLPEGLQDLTALDYLRIEGCPHLERRCKRETGEDWPKIAHIPHIRIDQGIFPLSRQSRNPVLAGLCPSFFSR